MKFNKYLDNILGRKTELKILRLFVCYKDELGVREIAREIKIGPPNVSRALKVLEGSGVLISKIIGRSVVYKLNKGHYLVDEVIGPLFEKEKKIIRERLSDFIVKNIKFPFESIVLFGSVARGTENDDSDVDVLFVLKNIDILKKAEDDVLGLNNLASVFFKNFFSSTLLTRKDFTRRYKAGDKLINNIVKDGIVIRGKIISELL